MWIAEEPSVALKEALQLLAQGRSGEAEMVVKKAAMSAKAKHGSGSHPLAAAYADIGRLHLRMGEFGKAAVEFQHACKSALPPDAPSRRDRLGFMYGFAEALFGLTRFDEAEKVLRQCEAFARNVHGATSPAAAAAKAPLADALLKLGKTADAMKLAQECYDELWRLGDPLITAIIPVRAEVLKAAGRTENPFADLGELPDDLVARTVSAVIARAPTGNPARVRAVLADLLAFADKKYGDGHTVTCDALAAVAHHEARQGDRADATVRRTAVRRSVWSYAVRRMPGGLLANLEIGFESDGTIHLVPHLAREPKAGEAAQLETILAQAVDDLYSRSA
jgi:tetratricopeptide (TPR) repeat protein